MTDQPTKRTPKRFRLTAADGSTCESDTPGEFGGNRGTKIYGRLDCKIAARYLPKGYARFRVFFADEAAAIAAGYRPCAGCLPQKYEQWKLGGQPGSADYPWLVLPK